MYEHARKGETVAVDSRKIHIDTFELDSRTFPVIGFQSALQQRHLHPFVSLRFGAGFGIGAHLKKFVQNQIGKYKLDDAYPLDKLINLITRKT